MTSLRRLRPVSLALAMACVLAGMLPGPAWSAVAEAQTPLERSVKAAFLFRFAGFVEWPAQAFPQADTPLTIGVYGADGVAGELGQILPGRTINGRPVLMRRVRDQDTLAGLHLLFVGRAETAQLPAIARAAQQRAVLVVSEAEGALAQGSVINFVLVDGRVRFEVSLDAAERSGLRLSSRMLAVAQTVRGTQ